MAKKSSFVNGNVIVGLKSGITSEQVDRSMFPEVNIMKIENLNIGLPSHKKVRVLLLLELSPDDEQGVLQSIANLSKNPNIEYVEPNYIMTID